MLDGNIGIAEVIADDNLIVARCLKLQDSSDGLLTIRCSFALRRVRRVPPTKLLLRKYKRRTGDPDCSQCGACQSTYTYRKQ